jgi:hypothetical protein
MSAELEEAMGALGGDCDAVIGQATSCPIFGHDELSAMAVCRAYVDAQREYASKDRNNDSYIAYAQKFLSDPGTHDGLYWPTKEGEKESPLGPAVVEAQAAGYSVDQQHEEPVPYYGYYYRILKGQGPPRRAGPMTMSSRAT